MKNFIGLILIFLLPPTAIFAQPQNEYEIFEMYYLILDVNYSENGSLIHRFTESYQTKRVSISPVTSMYVYMFTPPCNGGICPKSGGYTVLTPFSSTEYQYQNYVQIRWSPIADPTGAISNGGGSINRSSSLFFPNATVSNSIDIDKTLTFTANSAYTGSDLKWHLIYAGGDITIGSGQTLVITANSIRSQIGYNNKFIVRAFTPYYVNGNKSYRGNYMNLGHMEIVPKTITISGVGADETVCGGNINLSYNAQVSRTVDWQVGQFVSGTTWHWETFRPNITISGNVSTTVTYANIASYIDYPEKTVHFRAVFDDTSNPIVPYSEVKGGFVFYPGNPTFTHTDIKTCPNLTTGKVTITPSNTTINQAYYFYKDQTGTIPAGIDSILFNNETSLTRSNLNTNDCYAQGFYVDSAWHLRCSSIRQHVIIDTFATPNLTASTVTPSCSNVNDGKILANAPDINLSGSMRYFRTNPSGDSIAVNLDPLAAGTYYVRARDKFTCLSATKTAVIDATPAINFDTDRIQPSCFGDTNGIIKIKEIVGGSINATSLKMYINTAPITEVSACSNTSTGVHCLGSNFNGTSTYNLRISKTVSGKPECYSSSKPIIIGQPNKLVISPIATADTSNNGGYAIKCNQGSDGTITLHGIGNPTDILTYHLDGATQDEMDSTYNYFQGLKADVYEAWVTNQKGCPSVHRTGIKLSHPSGLSLNSPSYTKEKCIGTSDGSITVQISGGVAPYSYEWRRMDNTPVSGITNTLSGIGAGSYKVRVNYNSSQCYNDFLNLNLNPPLAIQPSTSSTNPKCIGSADGTITINSISNGQAPYTYVFNAETPQNAGTLPIVKSGLPAGNYPLIIRDANYALGGIYADKCTTSVSLPLVNKAAVQILDTMIVNVKCHNESTGSITINSITGPDNPHVEGWYNAGNTKISSTQNLTNIPDGTYKVKLIDNYNCTTEFTGLTVTEPTKLVFNSIVKDSASCSTVSDGSITILAGGGTSPTYRYSMNGGALQTSGYFGSLGASSYNLRITDQNLCVADTSVNLYAGNLVVNLLNSTNANCYGLNNGFMALSASGGGTNCRYSIDNGSSYSANNQFSNLAAATYQVKARDFTTSCVTTALSVPITQPLPLNLSLQLVDSAACNKPLGAIQALRSGGSGNYSLQWVRSQDASQGSSLTGLYAGNYTLTLRDLNSTPACTTKTSIVLPDRPSPVITSVDEISESWCSKPLGSLKANVVSGSFPFQYHWNDSLNQTSQTAIHLRAKTYTVTVTDRYGCTDLKSRALVDGPALGVTATTIASHCQQNDGSATILVSGGLSPYRYKWPNEVNPNIVYNAVMNSLYAGNYPVMVLDTVGCTMNYTVSVNDLNGPSIDSIQSTKAWCALPTGTALVAASGGTLPYSYKWKLNGQNTVLSAAALASNLYSGQYIAEITDMEGCIKSGSIVVGDSIELKPELLLVDYDSSACNKALGSLEVGLTGGLPPYAYQWQTTIKENTARISAITSGLYTHIATDSRGCKDTLEILLADKMNPVIGLVSKEDAYCGKPTGKALLKAAMGTEPYQIYLVNDPGTLFSTNYSDSLAVHVAQVENLLSSVQAHPFTLTDNNGCPANLLNVFIDDFNPMHSEVTDIVPVKCFGGTDGQVRLLVNNGHEPYHYSWSKSQVDNPLNTALPAGNGNCIITDAVGCSLTQSYSIPQPSRILLNNYSATSPDCHDGCNGSIQSFASGGTGKLLFTWNNGYIGSNGSGFCPGSYTITVSDTNNCAQSFEISVDNTPELKGVGLQSEVAICTGQNYPISLGNEWTNCAWTADNGFTATGNNISLNQTGTYYVVAFTDKACVAIDTVYLLVSKSLLTADFLAASEAHVGDTIVLIEISWPLPESVSWNFPEEANELISSDYYHELVFNDPGTYYLELTANLGECGSTTGKYIEILASGEVNENAEEVTESSLIKEFTAYPIPASYTINLRVKLADENNIRVEFIDINGGTIRKLMEESGLENYELSLNISDLKPGVYSIRVITGNEVKTKMIIVH